MQPSLCLCLISCFSPAHHKNRLWQLERLQWWGKRLREYLRCSLFLFLHFYGNLRWYLLRFHLLQPVHEGLIVLQCLQQCCQLLEGWWGSEGAKTPGCTYGPWQVCPGAGESPFPTGTERISRGLQAPLPDGRSAWACASRVPPCSLTPWLLILRFQSSEAAAECSDFFLSSLQEVTSII